jgi:hypothetical protein
VEKTPKIVDSIKTLLNDWHQNVLINNLLKLIKNETHGKHMSLGNVHITWAFSIPIFYDAE